jgi:hypothetical protein
LVITTSEGTPPTLDPTITEIICGPNKGAIFSLKTSAKRSAAVPGALAFVGSVKTVNALGIGG